MTECRRKPISVAAASPFAPPPPPSTPRLAPKSTSHPSPDSLFHLAQGPFATAPHPKSSVIGNTFLFSPTAPKKKLSDSAFLFSPEKRAKRNPLLGSTKQNVTLSFDSSVMSTAAAKLLSIDTLCSPSPSMRRSDLAIFNLDQASLGSPVAKRPSRRPGNSHFHHPTSSNSQTATPRRPPSRSLSNQNQPRPLQNLLHQQVQANHFDFTTPAPPNGKVSRRISVENFLRPPSRDSPFTSQGPNLDPSVHFAFQQNQNKKSKPHPLSFAESALLTPSTSSIASSSDHHNVSPSQSSKPQNPRVQNLLESQSQHSFYTPQAYKMAKPLQAAFMSEGLLSKRNRSNSTGPSISSLHMPDTPCKRPSSGTFGVFPQEPSTPLSGHTRHAPLFFDSDSSSSRDTPAPSNTRSLSYLSTKSDFEFPPTPTKSVENHREGTPGPLWRVHNLGKSPGGDSLENFPSGFEFPDISSSMDHRRRSATNGRLFQQHDVLGGRFGDQFEEIQLMGTGEFSEVYEVVDRKSGVKYAIKRTRFPLSGPKERQRRLEEVRALKALGSHEHILELIDSWEQYDHLFIQTELCENGSLDIFLRDYGNIERLDEFRVWKILLELSLGLQYIHDCEYIHLDIKPANVLITFEGTLKIGDFGLATPLPVPPGLEREGDREYIAPEILELQQYGKPADVFSLGMTILETAANVCLPDNGLPWQKLRSGDLSDAPRLSSSDGEVNDENGMDVEVGRPAGLEAGKLDDIVRWMLSPAADERPSCTDILTSVALRWVEARRRAGAVVYEGEFGPSEGNIVEENHVGAQEDWQMEL